MPAPNSADRPAGDRAAPSAEGELAARLADAVPREARRILAVGWESDDELALFEPGLADAVSIHRVDDLDEVGEQEPFDAVVWNAREGRGAGRARHLLTADGTLIVAAPSEAAAAGRGNLPARSEEQLRRVVRELSESGFAIRKELPLPGGVTVLVARRDPFTIRAYRPGDEAAILRLFQQCFHVERGLDHWRWKYRDNPYGAHRISLALSPAGELAAHYAGYPVPYWYADAAGERTFPALQMGDTMTDPAFRAAGRGRTGLLARTVRHFFALHRGGYGFFYGFNTGAIQRFCQWFIGGSRVEPVGYRVCDLSAGPPAAWSPDPGYRIERVTATDPAWDRLFRRAAPHYGFLAKRDARYVAWRYLRCPDARFVVLAARRWNRLVGWAVFRRRDHRLLWGDALFHPRHTAALRPLLATAIATPELAGATTLEAWFPERPRWWSRELPAVGLVPAPEPNGLAFMALPDTEPGATERLGELYYTMGDGDLF